MGSNLFKQPISRHRKIMNLYDKRPNVNHESFVAPNAAVVGDVFIGMQSSVWYGAVVRGEWLHTPPVGLVQICDVTVPRAACLPGSSHRVSPSCTLPPPPTR